MRARIEHQTFDEERALYHATQADLTDVTFAGPADGESALKEAHDVTLTRCAFSLRYPLWHTTDFTLAHCTMDAQTRAAIWYAKNGTITNSVLGGIKAVRACAHLRFADCTVDSPEFGWKSQDLTLERTRLTAEYPFFDSRDLQLRQVELHGKYSFQYTENVTIANSNFDTKDAFWHSKNVTVTDSVIKGEYLGWYAENLTLIRCKIIGTQPLCYCENLTLVDCEMIDCDLSFEYSDVTADVRGRIDSVKNPKSGRITADAIGEIIRDAPVIPCSAEIVVRQVGN